MDEQPYSNREIREMFIDIKDRLGRIETQTTKTNGRVTHLEMSEQNHKGAWGVWTYLGLSSGAIGLAWAGWITLHIFKV